MTNIALNHPQKEGKASPFLKWAGGKRWLLPLLMPLFRSVPAREYHEPFLGSGAAFFAFAPSVASLSDINSELIETFTAVKESPETLIEQLSSLTISREQFYLMRDFSPDSRIERAVRFIYLNRTAFNGLYRVNQKGNFNAPFGCKDGTTLVNPETLQRCAYLLRDAKLKARDFRDAFQSFAPGDLTYIDPPYTVSHNNNGFQRYNERIFSWQDQKRLAELCNDAARSGVSVIVSNALHLDVARLYEEEVFAKWKVTRSSRMSAVPKGRRVFEELLIVSRGIDLMQIVSKAGTAALVTRF